MEAIILAGGVGSRLKGTIGDIPKPMALVGGKPFLTYLLSWLNANNFKKVVISVCYKAEMISGYYGSKFGSMDLEYAVETAPLGTGGAIAFALRKSVGDNVMVVNGDTWFPIDIGRFTSYHSKISAPITLALKRMANFSRYGTVDLRGDTIVGFNEKKQCAEGLINGGIYMVNRSLMEGEWLPEKFSFETDILEKRVTDGSVHGVVFDAPFIDIGVPEDYLRAAEVVAGKI